MVEKQLSEEDIIGHIVTGPYKYGFKKKLKPKVSKGLDLNIIQKIIEKDEPEFLQKSYSCI